MKRFKYKAKSERGELVSGEVEGTNAQHAAKLVRGRGLFVISLTPASSLLSLEVFKRFGERASGSDIATFTRQLSTMVNAGLPITEALLILRSQSRGAMQKVSAQILADVEEGQALSTAMGKHSNVFSKTYIALIKSGEVGGVLDKVILKLSDSLEKQQEFRGKVKGALIYPAIIVIGMIAVALLMMIIVIPRMTSLYDQFDADLPVATQILMTTSDAMVNFWPIILLASFGAFWGYKTYRATDKGRLKTDELILKIPIIGILQKQIILTDLTRTMSLMVGSGVSILETLSIATQVAKNQVIANALKDTTKLVEKGFPLAFAFSKHPEAFPFILSQMIAVGEETGKMDEVMAKVSHVFEIESEQKVKTLTAAVEPIILIIMGIGVAFLVIAIVLPIYNLTTQL
jgi:type IV pilus assembly protein PilC